MQQYDNQPESWASRGWPAASEARGAVSSPSASLFSSANRMPSSTQMPLGTTNAGYNNSSTTSTSTSAPRGPWAPLARQDASSGANRSAFDFRVASPAATLTGLSSGRSSPSTTNPSHIPSTVSSVQEVGQTTNYANAIPIPAVNNAPKAPVSSSHRVSAPSDGLSSAPLLTTLILEQNAPSSFDGHIRGGDLPQSPFPVTSSGSPALVHGPSSHNHSEKLHAKNGSSIQPAPATNTINGPKAGDNSTRRDALAKTNGGPATVASPSPGPVQTLSGGGPLGSHKPVHKMKRTGQNVPPASPATMSLHRRNGSNSPIRKIGTNSPGSTTRKPFDSVQSKATGSPLTGLQSNPIARKTPVEKPVSTRPSAGPLGKLNEPSPAAGPSSRHRNGASGPTGLLPKVNHASRDTAGGRGSSSSASDSDSDGDDIMYEAAPAQGSDLDDLLGERPAGNDSSSDDSYSDDDETVEMDPREISRQAFRAPDQESDNDEEGDSEDDDEDDDDDDDDDNDASDSSSDDSSIANEPPVALPSANIQDQVAYPDVILSNANHNRPYTVWASEKGDLIKASPAIFPDGYQQCNQIQGFPWICAVRSCRQLYKTPAGLSNHFRFSHKKARLNDNMDGTLSLIGSYTKKNVTGRIPAVVVSRRALDPNEPPMPLPSILSKEKPSISQPTQQTAPIVLADDNGEDTMMGTVDSTSVGPREPQAAAADPGATERMWEYIRPHLKVHKTVPEKNWARHVIHLPRVRDVKWNQERMIEHPYRDSHPRDVTALIVQVTGVEASAPCETCLQGRGPFVGCVMISPEASEEAKASVLSCANCYYHCGQSKCSKCAKEVARRIRTGRQRPESYNVKLLSDVARGKSPAEANTHPHASFSRPSTSSSLQAYSRPEPRPYQTSEIQSIDLATCGTRPYKNIKGKNGEPILMCGALIPEKYDLDRTVPGYPWVCPVRSCRNVFKKILNLGSHFALKHRGNLYNDNLDGTLSQVGYYNQALPGQSTTPALIISQNPLDRNESPIETSSLPNPAANVSGNKAIKTKKIVLKRNSALPSQPKDSAPITFLFKGDARKMWESMLPYLPRPLNCMSELIDNQEVLNLLFSRPRKQDVRWRKTWVKRRLDDDYRQVVGLLLHLVGEEQMNGLKEKACTNCRRGEGPFPGCYFVPKNAVFEAHKYIRCCANCYFIHARESCSLKSNWQARISNNSHTSAGPPTPLDHTAGAGADANKRRRLSDSGMDVENEETRRSARRVDDAEPKRKIVTLSVHPKEDRRTPGSGGVVLRSTASTGGPSKVPTSAASFIDEGRVEPDDLLEMEDWEVAPGHIRTAGTERISNMAFSKSYLETNQAVRVGADVHFEVKTLRAGHALQLEADPSRTRYCSVARGKVRVTVQGQPEFSIGPDGLFKLVPGAKASVLNRLYHDSVLHVTSHQDC